MSLALWTSWVPIAVTPTQLRPRWPCPPRARSTGNWRSLTDNNGPSQAGLTCASGRVSGRMTSNERAFQARYTGRSTTLPARVISPSPTAAPEPASNIQYSSHPSRSEGGINCPGGTNPGSRQGTLVTWNSHTSRPGDPSGGRPGRDHQASVTRIGLVLGLPGRRRCGGSAAAMLGRPLPPGCQHAGPPVADRNDSGGFPPTG